MPKFKRREVGNADLEEYVFAFGVRKPNGNTTRGSHVGTSSRGVPASVYCLSRSF